MCDVPVPGGGGGGRDLVAAGGGRDDGRDESGVCAANLLEPMQFALGPTMLARRECVAEIGGFEAMVEYCADDFVLGNWIARRDTKWC